MALKDAWLPPARPFVLSKKEWLPQELVQGVVKQHLHAYYQYVKDA